MLLDIYKGEDLAVYKIDEPGGTDILINKYIVTTKLTREICNDSRICGIEFSGSLQTVSTRILKVLPFFSPLTFLENDAVVLNVVRAGLCFGIREALAEAYSWNQHSSLFICPKHLETDEHLHVIEKAHKTFDLPNVASLFIGDIIATGESLHKSLDSIINEAKENNCQIKNIVLITYGSINAEQILLETAKLCANLFDNFEGVEIFYLEGRFEISENELCIKSDKEMCTEKELV